MLILGLDIACAWYEPGSSLSIKTGLIKAIGENAEEQGIARLPASRHDQGNRPDFVSIEQPMANVVSFKTWSHSGRPPDAYAPSDEQTANPIALQREGLACAAAAIISDGYGIHWETIPLSTQRKHFLGMGCSPGFDHAM
ncbi:MULTISPECIES: hypothetical protein [unclassified Mesorhizobium]